VINRQSFGWTLQFEVPWLLLAAFGLLVVASGWVVAALVGRANAEVAAEREE
jgi:putative ABC transport system permease protein